MSSICCIILFGQSPFRESIVRNSPSIPAFFVDLNLVLFLLVITGVAIDPEVLDYQSVFWKPEIRIEQSGFPLVDHNDRILILVGNPISIKKPGYLFFAPTLMRGWDTVALVRPGLSHGRQMSPVFLSLCITAKTSALTTWMARKKRKSCCSGLRMLTSAI